MKNLVNYFLVIMMSLSMSHTLISASHKVNNTNLETQVTKIASSKDVIFEDINYKYMNFYYTHVSDSSDPYSLLKWTDYAKNWDDFKEDYIAFTISGLIISGFEGHYPITVDTLGISLVWYLPYYLESTDTSFYFADNTQINNFYTKIFLNCWYDDTNIRFQWKAYFSGNISNMIVIKIDSVAFRPR